MATQVAKWAAAMGVCLLPWVSEANPHPLPFSYPYETLPAGKLELEQYADVASARVLRTDSDGSVDTVRSLGSTLQTEVEYGLTDRLEFAWYFVLAQQPSASPSLAFEGFKQRLRLRLAEDGAWPVNVGLYVEVAEFHDEVEFEQKILLSRRFGRLNLVANLWVEQGYEFQENKVEVLFNPTLGTSYELSPNFMVGAEYWMHGNFEALEPTSGPIPAAELADRSIYHYLGPTFLAQRGELWGSIGTYLRMDKLTSRVAVGDPYGKLWVRAAMGLGF